MSVKKAKPGDQQQLYRRYLLWCYKTTREALEKVDRKFTQLEVDRFILKDLSGDLGLGKKDQTERIQPKITEFEEYIKQKERNAMAEKFFDSKNTARGLTADYGYLQKRYQAIQRAVKKFCGAMALTEFDRLYEEEMTRRILEARED